MTRIEPHLTSLRACHNGLLVSNLTSSAPIDAVRIISSMGPNVVSGRQPFLRLLDDLVKEHVINSVMNGFDDDGEGVRAVALAFLDDSINREELRRSEWA